MEDIRRYENMAKLALPQEEHDWLQRQADWLDEAFAALEAVETGDTPPLVSVLTMQNVLREDVSAQPFSREALLALAPQQHDHCFQVPKTLE